MSRTQSRTGRIRSRLRQPGLYVANRIERLSDTQFVYLMLLPVFALLGAMAFWPLIRTFILSLHADNLLGSGVGQFVGIENYVRIFTGEAILRRPLFDPDQLFISAIPVTLIFTVVAVAFETILGFGMALILNDEFRGRRWARLALLLPWAVPIVIQGMIFYLLFTPSVGFITEPLHSLGLLSSSPLANSQDALFVTIAADIWKQSAFMALLILAGLQSIDRNLYDVAKISGASKLQQFRTITFPLVLPALLVALLFRSIAALKVYGTIETISNCNTVPSVSCLVVSMWNVNRVASAAAIAFVVAALIGLLLLVYFAAFRRQSAAGGF